MALQAWHQYLLQLKYDQFHESLKPTQFQGLPENHLSVIQDCQMLICKHEHVKALLKE